MAFCTRCGQQTEADEEFCLACGGGYAPDAYSVGAYPGPAAGASHSPADSYATPDQSRRFPDPDPTEFRSQLRAADSALGRSAPGPTAAARDRQLRYTQSAADALGLTGAERRYQSDRENEPDGVHKSDRVHESDRVYESGRRYTGETASPALSPTGRLPEFGQGTGQQDLPGYPAVPDDHSWPSRQVGPDAPSDQYTWAAPDLMSDSLTGPHSGPIAPREPADYTGLAGPSGPYSSPGPDAHARLDADSSLYARPDADAFGRAGAHGPSWSPEPDSYSGLTGPSGPHSPPKPDSYSALTGPSGPHSPPEPDAYAGLTGPSSPYGQPGADAYARPGAVDYSSGLSGPGTLSTPGGLAAPGARDRRAPGDLGVNRRSQEFRNRRDVPAGPPPRQGPPRNGRWITMAATTTVLIIAAAVAYLLVGHRGTSARAPQAGSRSTAVTPSGPAATSAPASTVSGLLTVAASAANAPQEPAVVAFLNRYFRAINSHRYSAYQRLFSPALRSGLSAAAFSSGYGTTKDSAATLHSISVTTAGELDVAVTFTSHQQATDSPTNSTCTAWTISLYLSRSRGRYVLQTPPASYQPSFRSCS